VLVIPALANDGCGGRRPIDDVIDVTYGTLVLGNPGGFGDGVAQEPGKITELFPYMVAP